MILAFTSLFLHQTFEDILVPENFAHSQECPSLEIRGKIHPIRLVDLVGNGKKMWWWLEEEE